MSLKVGIVGLANVGKSTLFNILLNQRLAESQNYPFTTIDPNVGIVNVPDPRLQKLAETIKKEKGVLPPVVPATIQVVDIAGLVAGAHKGEGLGNKFLANIREVSVIIEVVRVFNDGQVVPTGQGPKEDIETIRLEFALKDLETIKKYKEALQKRRFEKTAQKELAAIKKIEEMLSKNNTQSSPDLGPEEKGVVSRLQLLSFKPTIYLFNLSEDQLADTSLREELSKTVRGPSEIVFSCLKSEAALIGMSAQEKEEYLRLIGGSSSLDKLLSLAYSRLGLISFFTAGVKEVRAWTIKKGATAPEAAGKIHTDFQRHFIKAKVVSYQDFVDLGGWQGATEAGKVIFGGRDYVINDGQVVEFIVGKGR